MKESLWLEEIKKKGWMIEIGVTIILPCLCILELEKSPQLVQGLSLTTSIIFGATSPSNHLMQYVPSSSNVQPNDVERCGVGSILSEFVQTLAT